MNRRDGKPKNKRAQTTEEKRASVRATQRKLKHDVVELLGAACVLCGLTDERCLEIDHIDNNGGKLRKEAGSPWTHLRGIRDGLLRGENEYNVRLLCANCHSIETWHRKDVLT